MLLMQCLSLLQSFAKQSLNSGYAHCRWVQIFDKVFNLFRLLENEILEMFSKRERRKSKHKFGGTKVFKAEVVRSFQLEFKLHYM